MKKQEYLDLKRKHQKKFEDFPIAYALIGGDALCLILLVLEVQTYMSSWGSPSGGLFFIFERRRKNNNEKLYYTFRR